MCNNRQVCYSIGMGLFMKKTILLVCYALLSLSFSQSLYGVGLGDLGQVRASVFKILNVSVQPDYTTPWNDYASTSSSGTGFYIGNKQIMTNAHVIANSRFLMVLRDGESEPVPARILHIANDSDLAVLTVDQPGYFDSIKPLRFSESVPSLRSPVAAVGYPMGGDQISITEGVVSRHAYDVYVHDGRSRHFSIQVDSAINPGNSGGPVVQKQKVVGVAFQTFTAIQNTGYIIPVPMVQRFLTDIKDGHYDGAPFHGIATQEWALINPSTRVYFGRNAKDSRGILVNDIAGYSVAAKFLKRNDILLSIDGKEIGVDGKIKLYGERINFRTIFDFKQYGDTISFQLVRDNKEQKVTYRLAKDSKHYDSSNSFEPRPKYYQVGGLVYTALSVNLLKTWGSGWGKNSPFYLKYFNYFHQQTDYRNNEDIIVLLSKLGHPVNSYVQTPLYSVVKSVNGAPVKSLRELKNKIEGLSEKYIKIEYAGMFAPTVLNRQEALEASPQIAASYKVDPPDWLGSEAIQKPASEKGSVQ